MTQIKTNIAENIIRIRKEKGLSQQEVAEYAGLTRSTVANIERGVQRPSIEFLMAFSSQTNQTLDTIAGNTQADSENIKTIFRSLYDSDIQTGYKRQIKEIETYCEKLEEKQLEVVTKYNDLLTAVTKARDSLKDQ